MKKAARIFWTVCGLTVWAGIWWANGPEDVLRYFLQAVLFATVALTLQEGAW